MDFQLEQVMAARARIKPHIHRTALFRSRRLDELTGCNVYVKAEFQQKTGAFKARGALHFILAAHPNMREYTTFSSGNHGQAVSWAAQSVGAKATIFMPEDASSAKIAGVRAYGGEARFAGLSSSDRMQACLAYAKDSGAVVVPPYDHEAIIAGQGTVMLEILEDLPVFDAALIPTGGGGLLSGNAFVLSQLRPRTEVFACEPAAASDAAASLESGQLQKIPYPSTIADGQRNLCLGERNWSIIKDTVREGLVCEEEQIREAMRAYASYTKHVVEPSGATSLACLMANRERFAGKKVVIIASGGNIGLDTYAQLVTPV